MELERRVKLAGVLSLGIAALAVLYDRAGTASNIIADSLIGSVATVGYQVWVTRKIRRDAEDRAWASQRPFLRWLNTIDDQARTALRSLTEGSRPWILFGWPYDWDEELRVDVRACYDNIRAHCLGPNLDSMVDDYCDALRISFTTGVALQESRDSADQVTTIRLREDASQALSIVGVQSADLYNSVSRDYYPEEVARRVTPDPLPQSVAVVSNVVAVTSLIVWIGGLWPGHYAGDVLDNVLVGLSGLSVGVGFAYALALREKIWLARSATIPIEKVRSSAQSLKVWVNIGTRNELQTASEESQQWQEVRNSAASALEARPLIRAAVSQLQRLAPDARLDAAADRLDELVRAALTCETDLLLKRQVAPAVDRLLNLLDELYPKPLERQPTQRTQPRGLLRPSEWDDDLTSQHDYMDPFTGPWQDRIDSWGS